MMRCPICDRVHQPLGDAVGIFPCRECLAVAFNEHEPKEERMTSPQVHVAHLNEEVAELEAKVERLQQHAKDEYQRGLEED